MTVKQFLAVSAIVASSVTTAHAATIVNGGFEQPGTFNGGFTTLGSGNSSLTGWDVSGAGVDLINTLWEHSEGSYSLDLSAGNSGSISQNVTGLVQGQTYRILFDMAANTADGNDVKSLTAFAGKSGGGSFTFDGTGQSNSDMGWEEKSFEFVAEGTSEILGFLSNEPNAWGPALDNIRIERIDAQVPLPAGALLLLSGVGVLAMRRKRA